MPRAQCIVTRGRLILMAKHSQGGLEWWCLPGGGVEPGETPEQAALRELGEECGVIGRIVRQTSLDGSWTGRSRSSPCAGLLGLWRWET